MSYVTADRVRKTDTIIVADHQYIRSISGAGGPMEARMDELMVRWRKRMQRGLIQGLKGGPGFWL